MNIFQVAVGLEKTEPTEATWLEKTREPPRKLEKTKKLEPTEATWLKKTTETREN
jgi:hypothetical protein